MRVVFFGSGAFGLPTLERLAAVHDLRAVITQPDRPAGRGGRTTPTPIGAFAADRLPSTPLRKPERIGDEVDAVRAIEADAWVVIAYGQKLPPALLADRFAVNLHASRLPRWRGAAPIHAAVVAGDEATGNSVIALADRMDAGGVYAQSRRAIGPDQTTADLHDLLAADGPDLVESVLRAHADGAAHAETQDEALVTLAPKLSKADAWVDFAGSAFAAARRINGLSPWPGVTATFRDEAIKLLRARTADDASAGGDPGHVIDAAGGLIACGDGACRLIEVQPPGKKPMRWRDFANGRGVHTGDAIIGKAPSA